MLQLLNVHRSTLKQLHCCCMHSIGLHKRWVQCLFSSTIIVIVLLIMYTFALSSNTSIQFHLWTNMRWVWKLHQIFYYCTLVRSIAVLMTNVAKPFNKDGFATFQLDSLSTLDQFTICARFRAYQFNDMYYYTQSVISLHSNILFGSFTTGDKCTFKDCATYWKNYFGEIWKYGKAFSFTNSYGYFTLMSELRPRKWYS